MSNTPYVQSPINIKTPNQSTNGIVRNHSCVTYCATVTPDPLLPYNTLASPKSMHEYPFVNRT